MILWIGIIAIILLLLILIIRFFVTAYCANIMEVYFQKQDEYTFSEAIKRVSLDAKLARFFQKENLDKNINSLNQNYSLDVSNLEKIVGIVKPIGPWTKLILGKKLPTLMEYAKLVNQGQYKGYWVTLLEAQRLAEKSREKEGQNKNRTR